MNGSNYKVPVIISGLLFFYRTSREIRKTSENMVWCLLMKTGHEVSKNCKELVSSKNTDKLKT